MTLINRRLFAPLLIITLALWLPTSKVLADTLALPTIIAVSTDGSATSASFALRVTSDTATSRLTTQQALDLSVLLKPDPADVGRIGSVYAIFVKDNSFFMLTPDRRFTTWDGGIDTLAPFATQVTLNAETSVSMLSGRMDNPGEYQIFIAYAVEGAASLDYTPSPAILMLNTATQSPFVDEALALFKTKVEDSLIQMRCVTCHVTGGLARNSALQFQRTMTGSALNNLNMLQSYLEIEGKSAQTLLTKATGGNSHTGGQQITKDSNDYNTLLQVLTLLEQDKAQRGKSLAYTFIPAQLGKPSAATQSFLSAVILEPREATLRRAMILFAGRAPTAEELKAVRDGDDKTLRASLRGLMTGQQFREFIVRATNDRLLTEGADGSPINANLVNFPILRNLKYEVTLKGGEPAWNQYQVRIETVAQRASGELVAHVIMNDRPYSEILTADYMMMNPLVNQMLGGTATFPAGAGDSDFLPAKITQYYFHSEIVQTPSHPVAGVQVLSRGKAMADYPHAGLLTDFAFLARYPTTATNRNRARARWTLYHFLGIDIEKSSQRPTNEAALSDRNNPTLNNPACGVCHTVMDPVAGAFQNWSDRNLYRQDNGNNSLDQFYKNPPYGSKSLYQQGDLWYRDMRAPGLFETPITSRDYTLRELAGRIVKEPAFLTAAARFWWPAIFGSQLVQLPAVTDQGFAEKSAAYLAQQAELDLFATSLGQGLNAKDMLVEMLMSPWFSATSTTHYEFQTAHLEADLGAEQLLTPDQLAAKTLNLTGAYWRSAKLPDGSTYSKYDELGVLLGGIDSRAVTERATLLTPSMMAILQTHTAELACPIVVKDFALPLEKRRLFTTVTETLTPLSIARATVDVTSTSSTDWQEHKITAPIPANGAEIKVSFINPWCDYDGVKCVEQRVLFVDALTLRHASGAQQRFEVTAPEVRISGQHCYINGSNATFYNYCTLSLALKLDKPDTFEVVAHLAAQQAPSRPERVQASIEVVSTEDILKAQTNNARLIKQQIIDLFTILHGTTVAIDSKQVQQTYALFAVALTKAGQSSETTINHCQTYVDSNFITDLLTAEQLKIARTPSTNGNYYGYEMDWDYVRKLTGHLTIDSTGAKRAWIAVITYLLSHYDYLHE